MPRQLSVRTVVAWFGGQSLEQQGDTLAQLGQAHEETRSAKRAELERQLAALDGDVRKSHTRARKSVNGSANGATRTKVRGSKVKAKYRNPKTKATWSGRGRMASWLKAKQDAGEKIEKYLV
jgi:DNA-binding protein H-NS